jgi:hypothetical protein
LRERFVNVGARHRIAVKPDSLLSSRARTGFVSGIARHRCHCAIEPRVIIEQHRPIHVQTHNKLGITMNSRDLRRMLALAVMAAMTISAAHAQQQWRLPPAVLGLYANGDYGHFAPINTTYDIANDPYANHTTTISGGMMVIFPKVIANGFGLSADFSYGQYRYRAASSGNEPVTNGLGTNVTAQVSHEYDLTTQALQMDMLIYGQVGDIARIEVGPWVGFGYLPRYTETATILTPGVTYEGGATSQTQSRYVNNEAVGTLGGMVRASLEIPIPGGMALLPFAQLRAAAASSTNGNNIGVVGMFGGGVGILFGRPNGVEIDAPPPTSAADTVPVAPTSAPIPETSLKATVNLFSRDISGLHRDTLMLTTHRTLHRLEVPLMAEFHFERNSAALPARYGGYSAATHGDFTLDAFADKSPSELHLEALNVIGMRLAANPSATVTITGNALPDEPKWFAGARADAVSGYLRETWGVRKEQIGVKNGAGARGGPRARSVTITSATPGILAPIATEWIEQDVSPAPIGLEPEIVAPTGIKEWHASIRQGEREIAIVRNSDSAASGVLSAVGLVADIGADGSVPSVTVEMIVEDSAGGSAVAYDELAVRRAPGDGDTNIEHSVSRYFVLGGSGAETDRTIARIVASVADSASIVLRPVQPANRDGIAPQAQERLRYVAERLRAACAATGKRDVTIAAREATAMAAGDHEDSDTDQFASPIELTVID